MNFCRLKNDFFRFALPYFTKNDPYAMQAINPQIRHLILKNKKKR